MFHSFHVPRGGGSVKSQEIEELDEHTAPTQLSFGDRGSFRREREAAITFVAQEAAPAQLLHHGRDAGTFDAEGGGDVRHARVAFGGYKFSDALETIFSICGKRARKATLVNAH